jgi:hypothetical protein
MRGMLLALVLCAAGPVLAGDAPTVDINRGEFEAQRERVMAALADGETFSEIDASGRAIVVDGMARMSELVAGAGGGVIDPARREALVEEQRTVNAALARAAADSRMVCRRERPTGTNRPTNVCMTVAQRTRLRRESRTELMQQQQGNLVRPRN